MWVVEYMCIYEPGHIRCRCRFRTRCRFRPTPSLRCAALRGSVIEPRFEGWPGSARRRRRGTFTRPVSPRRALRRWGAGRPRVLGRSRSQAERLPSGRRVEARSAALRSVDTPAPRASRRPQAPTAIHPVRPARAPSCRGEARACPSEAARAILTDFYPVSALPEGSGPERRSEWLTRLLRNSDDASRRNRTPVPGRAARPPRANVTTLTR